MQRYLVVQRANTLQAAIVDMPMPKGAQYHDMHTTALSIIVSCVAGNNNCMRCRSMQVFVTNIKQNGNQTKMYCSVPCILSQLRTDLIQHSICLVFFLHAECTTKIVIKHKYTKRSRHCRLKAKTQSLTHVVYSMTAWAINVLFSQSP